MPPRPELTLAHALTLGVLHGPAELLPVSSSAHVALMPGLLGWEEAELDGDRRKALEVALHAGTAAGLVLALRGDVATGLRRVDARRALFLALSLAPAGVAGLALERPIERRLGTAGTIAAGLVAGSVVLVVADARGPDRRHASDASWRDGLALGLAQAAALVPGVSRNGATLAAARARGFARADAAALSREVALPVIAGASALKGLRIARRPVAPGARSALAAGVGASFVSALASARLVALVDGRSPWPFAAYRVVLAALALARADRPVRDHPGA